MSADAPAPSDAPLLRIRDLQIEFARHGAEPMKAVKGIDLELKRGESIALVGESGSGKSATALSFARLLPEPPAAISARQMSFNGHEILEMGEHELRKIRGKP